MGCLLGGSAAKLLRAWGSRTQRGGVSAEVAPQQAHLVLTPENVESELLEETPHIVLPDYPEISTVGRNIQQAEEEPSLAADSTARDVGTEREKASSSGIDVAMDAGTTSAGAVATQGSKDVL